MPTLPTFTVTQATADRLLAAFSGQVDEAGVELTPVQAYRRWLKQTLVNRVMQSEANDNRAGLESNIPD
jgi:hypothetical protein